MDDDSFVMRVLSLKPNRTYQPTLGKYSIKGQHRNEFHFTAKYFVYREIALRAVNVTLIS